MASEGELRRETLTVNRTLLRRYYLVEKTKDADIIGILAGTLGVGTKIPTLQDLVSIYIYIYIYIYIFDIFVCEANNQSLLCLTLV